MEPENTEGALGSAVCLGRMVILVPNRLRVLRAALFARSAQTELSDGMFDDRLRLKWGEAVGKGGAIAGLETFRAHS
jgi:hypothetical protein